MNASTAFAEMSALDKELLRLNDLHHNKDISEITDAEFDRKQQRFEELCELYPDLAKTFKHQDKPVAMKSVGNGEGLALVQFTTPMQSLKKALSHKEVEVFKAKPLSGYDENYSKYFAEYKLDGLALDIRYLHHELYSIFTRGDGFVGEDVTHCLPMFSNIPRLVPSHLPDDINVRGEGVVSFKNYNRYNETSDKPKATPRNAAAGWIRTMAKNQEEDAFGLMEFFIYGSSDDVYGDTVSYQRVRNIWEAMGFTPSPPATEEDILNNNRLADYPVDGIVIKVNQLSVRNAMGVTNKYPNWAIAYKFPDDEVEAAYSHMVWKTGKTGRVNPTIHYHPVTIGGVTCQRASVDNYHQFLSLGLRDDTMLGITRNGDVIPRVNRVIDPGVGERVQAPDTCPSCGSTLRQHQSKGSAFLYCDNVTACPSQLLNRCLVFVSRTCLDIDGLGPVTLSEMIDAGKIVVPADILDMEPYANHFFKKLIPLYKIIFAMGLPGVEAIRAKKIAQALDAGQMDYTNAYEVMDWLKDIDNLKLIGGFSDKLSAPIVKAVNSELVQLNALKLFEMARPIHTIPLESIKVCITGEVGVPRETLAENLEEFSIVLLKDVTKECNLLVLGDKPGKKKIAKAEQLKIPLLYVEEKVSTSEALANIINNAQSNLRIQHDR